MVKAKAKTTKVTELTTEQKKILVSITESSVTLAKMKAGESIDATSTQLEKIMNKLKKKFTQYNNRGILKAQRKEKLEAKRTKLTKQLAEVTKQLG